ncbi:MAG: hypothetical protein AABZ53_01190 [Planctomycetota bacterium]
MYRCEAASVAGFIQQLAVSYVRHGYWFYVTGVVPAEKDPRGIDAKLVQLYDIDVTKWARAWRKALGQASMQYLRYNRFFILMATHGEHAFFDRERDAVRDCRRVPIKFFGYSVSHRGGHPCVRIEQAEYLRVKAYFEDLATRRTSEQLGAELGAIGWIPYAPVRRQLFMLLRAVNNKRRAAGLGAVSHLWLDFERRIVAPFGVPLAARVEVQRRPVAGIADPSTGMPVPMTRPDGDAEPVSVPGVPGMVQDPGTES